MARRLTGLVGRAEPARAADPAARSLRCCKFLVVLFLLKWRPLRMLLTPGATKTRRVRRRAIMLFKTGGERRTIGRTGILIYLSMAEHRAEIVADEAITAVTTPETWGEAMTALLTDVKAGRPGDGIVAAVEIIGEVLAEHFPKSQRGHQRNPRQADRAMSGDKIVEWEGKYLRIVRDGTLGICRALRRSARGRYPRRA